jgi:hypothetical protein
MSQAILTVEVEQDAVRLPQPLRDRYGLKSGMSVRIIETRKGILLIPLTDEPLSRELQEELTAWQAASLQSPAWDMFPYDDAEDEA